MGRVRWGGLGCGLFESLCFHGGVFMVFVGELSMAYEKGVVLLVYNIVGWFEGSSLLSKSISTQLTCIQSLILVIACIACIA